MPDFCFWKTPQIELAGKTMGIVGYGRIGHRTAQLAAAFGMKIIAHNHRPKEAPALEGFEWVELDELFARADVVSLHCPLTHDTFQIINKQTLATLKEGAMLINTSRGKLIDTDAAIDALKNKKMGYLGIDVYAEEEKLFFKDLSEMIIDDDKISRLMQFPNVLITAHQGFLTKEALQQIATTTLQNLTDYEHGVETRNEVTNAQVHSA
jgi:D-lactate dehydrogenase